MKACSESSIGSWLPVGVDLEFTVRKHSAASPCFGRCGLPIYGHFEYYYNNWRLKSRRRASMPPAKPALAKARSGSTDIWTQRQCRCGGGWALLRKSYGFTSGMWLLRPSKTYPKPILPIRGNASSNYQTPAGHRAGPPPRTDRNSDHRNLNN